MRFDYARDKLLFFFFCLLCNSQDKFGVAATNTTRTELRRSEATSRFIADHQHG